MIGEAVEEIIGILKHHEAGMKTADLCREHGVSAATFYGWKSKFGSMEVSDAQRLDFASLNWVLRHIW